MSVLVHSHDLYLSTQQSGSVGSAQSTFDHFKVCLNRQPLRCKTGEVLRLSLTQFSCYRNFYHINKFNNRVDVTYTYTTGPGATSASQTVRLDEGDYDRIDDIAANFGEKLKTLFASIGVTVSVTNNTNTSQRILDLEFTSTTSNNITSLLIRCPQFTTGDETTFNDSYCILGGKRISDQNSTEQSFNLNISSTSPSSSTISIQGFFPMQKSSTQYLYLTCDEHSDNLESQNLSAAKSLQDTHIIKSSIIAKIPIQEEICGYQAMSPSPYYITTNNQHISDLIFKIVDHHGRKIPKIQDIQTEGNLFSDMTLKVETFAVGGGEHTLNAPHQNFHYESNGVGQIRNVIG